MFSPSDFNTAVPQFTNGNYASNPLNPLYIEEPSAIDYNRGVEPLQTLPAQWWNWLGNQFTAKLNKINLYVKNIFDELTQLLSLVGMTPDATEGSITTNQLKTAFTGAYPNYISKFMHTLAEAWSYIGTTVVGDVTTTQTNRLAIFEHVNVSDASTTPATETDTYKTKYIDKLPIVLGGTGGSTAQEAMTNLSTPLPTINTNTGLITDAVLFERESGGVHSVQKMTMNEVGRIVSSTRVNVPVIVTNSTTINSATLEINDSIRIVFTADITGSDTSTALELTYNNSVIPIKVPKNGSLVGLYAHELYEGGVYVYKYLQAYTTFDLYYDGTNFVLLENPIVLSSADYTIYADGFIEYAKIFSSNIDNTKFQMPAFNAQAVEAQYTGLLYVRTVGDNSATELIYEDDNILLGSDIYVSYPYIANYKCYTVLIRKGHSYRMEAGSGTHSIYAQQFIPLKESKYLN